MSLLEALMQDVRFALRQLRKTAGFTSTAILILSDGFFRTLAVAPSLGRDSYPGEDSPSASRTTLVSYAAWQQRYGGNANVLGQTVTLDGVPNVIEANRGQG